MQQRRYTSGLKRIRGLWLLLLLLLLCECTPHSAEEKFPDMYKVSCIQQRHGCACYDGPYQKKELRRLFHAQAVRAIRKARNGLFVLGREKEQKRCWYPRKNMLAMPYAKVLHSRFQDLDHSPLSLQKLIGSVKPRHKKQIRLGHFWPTYYHLALEDFHPVKAGNSPSVAILGRKKEILGKASQAFLEQVRWQGSGISKSGLRLHVLSTQAPLRFESYPASMWGWGAGEGYKVFPYRTLAVNFKALCKALGIPRKSKCKKNSVIGTLIYIKEVAKAKITMPGGRKHDGYFCANDTGSPYYIRADRIDIFVGSQGGGNPYLPPQRQGNALIQGGIQNLVPSDWRLWRSQTERVWCPSHRIPAHLKKANAKDCTHDYHVTARHKALELYAFLNADGSLIKCRKL